MVTLSLSRRAALLGLAASSLALPARAETVTDLTWADLVPRGDDTPPPILRRLMPHDEGALAASQPESSGIRTDLNGQIVRLSGYVVPIDHKGTGITAFILVPFVGACVHVPPPPANQLVFVTTETPFEGAGLFEAVTVTGMFGAASMSTQLAEIGYALSAEEIRTFRP